MKRTRIKRKSKRYAAATVAWAERWDKCWRCRRPGRWALGTLDVHHICGGSSRKADELTTTAMVCRRCHTLEDTKSGLGMEGWLALKRQWDFEHYDLVAFNLARRRAATAITEAEVDEREAEMRVML